MMLLASAPLSRFGYPQKHVSRQLGMFIHFNMPTFSEKDTANDGSTQLVDPNTFNPTSLSVTQWIDAAASAGAKYACLTVKHQDGFCLWPSATTSYHIGHSSWYANNGSPDIAGLFANACRSASIVPYFYLSVRDLGIYWDFNGANIDENESWLIAHEDLYRTRLNTQIKELLTGYGAIGGIWFDSGEWFFAPGSGYTTISTHYPWRSSLERWTQVHSNQKPCLVINNCHTGSLADSDIITYETIGSVPAPGNTDPAEQCFSLRGDNKWFWHTASDTPKSAATVISAINYNISANCATLINAGPANTGQIPSEIVSLLAQIGAR